MNKTLLKLAAVGAAVTMLLSLLMIAGCKQNPSPNNTTNSGSGNHTTENNLDTTDHEGVEDVFQDIDVPINDGDQDDTQSGESGGELVVSRPDNSDSGQSQSGQTTQSQSGQKPQATTPSTGKPQETEPEQSQTSQPTEPEGTESQPVDPIAAMTYEKFRGLPSSEKMAFRALFVDGNGNIDDEAFIVWYNNAQKEYEASKDKTDDLDMSTAPRD